jgi:hypothetical protein
MKDMTVKRSFTHVAQYLVETQQNAPPSYDFSAQCGFYKEGVSGFTSGS